MATGTTSDFNITRNDIISSALRKIGGWPEDGNPPLHKLREAIRALNLLLRKESAKGSGIAQHLWARDSKALILSANGLIYSSDEGLPTTLQEISAASYRDTTGSETPLKILSPDGYAALNPKNESGDPTSVYLSRAVDRDDNVLYVWPAPTAVGTTSQVRVTNNLYNCILKHESSTLTKPATGASWKIYWQLDSADAGDDTWADETDYTNGSLVFLSFKRPLFDFDTQYDNPDFPAEWGNYLIYQLATDLAPEYGIGMDHSAWLMGRAKEERMDLFPSSVPQTNTYHNKATYF